MPLAAFGKIAISNTAFLSNSTVASGQWRIAYAREFVWVALAQAAAFVGGLVTVKAAAVVLGPAEYGKLSIALAIVGIFQVCFYGAISQTATRFFGFASARHRLSDYKLSLLKLIGFAAAAVVSLWILGGTFGVQNLLPVPAAILCAYAITSGAQMVAIAVFNAARKREFVATLQSAEAFMRPVLIIIITYLEASTADYALFAYLISSCLIFFIIVGLWSMNGWSSATPEPRTLQFDGAATANHLTWGMTTFAAPFVVFGILGAIGSHGERLLLAKWVNWSDVGTYALMTQLVMAPNVLFTTVINQFYFPLVFQFDPGGTRDLTHSFRRYLLISIIGASAITTLIALLGPLVIPVFSSRAFLGHEHLLWFLGASAGLFCVAQQLVLPGLRLNKPAVYMPAKLIHSVLLLGMSFVLVPSWGVDGMGIASFVSSAGYLSAMMLANVWLKRNSNSARVGGVQA
jgi:O-antigen/teichoic acid export membrane protein